MVLALKWPFFQLFFLGKIGQKNVFYDTEQKMVQNWPFLRLFFFGGMGQENVFYDILERKMSF